MEIIFVLIFALAICSLYAIKKPEEATFRGETYCRNRSHLIRLEKVGEIFVVETHLEAAILLQCKFCDEGDSRQPRIWYRQNHTTGEIKENEFILSGRNPRIKETQLHSFVNYNVSINDVGLYYCKFPYEDSFSSGFNFLIEIVNKTNGDDTVNGTIAEWKSYSDKYLVPVNEELKKQYQVAGTDVKVQFEVFSSWSAWSFCEICIKNPHQYQIAHCRVRAVCIEEICSRALAKGATEEEAGIVRLLLNTSTSLPCRGYFLRHFIPEVADLVQSIPDFRHNQSCQPSCPLIGGPTATGSIQMKLLNLEEGQSAVLSCPGQLGNTKVRWEFNKRKMNPNEWNAKDGPVLIDHFGTVHFNDVTKNVKGTYKCFSHNKPVFEAKVRVRRKAKVFGKGFFRHFRYLLSIILACFIIFILIVISACCRSKYKKKRKSNNKKRKSKVEDLEMKPLLLGEGEDGFNSESEIDNTYYGREEDESDQQRERSNGEIWIEKEKLGEEIGLEDDKETEREEDHFNSEEIEPETQRTESNETGSAHRPVYEIDFQKERRFGNNGEVGLWVEKENNVEEIEWEDDKGYSRGDVETESEHTEYSGTDVESAKGRNHNMSYQIERRFSALVENDITGEDTELEEDKETRKEERHFNRE